MKAKKAKEAKEVAVWKVPRQIPDEKAIAKHIAPLLERAGAFEIRSEDHFLASWLIVQDIDRAVERVEETFNPFIEALHKLHKMAIALRNQFRAPLEKAKMRLMHERYTYRELEERRRIAAEAKLAEGLQKQQQKELEKQAKAAEKKGELQVAEALREQKASVPLPTLFASGPAVPKQEGSVIRERWIYTIVDPAAVEREFCSPDDKLIRPVVEALGPACKISGLKIEKDKSEYSRKVGNG